MVNVVALAYVQVSHAEIQPSELPNTSGHVPIESDRTLASSVEVVDPNWSSQFTLSALSVFRFVKLSLMSSNV